MQTTSIAQLKVVDKQQEGSDWQIIFCFHRSMCVLPFMASGATEDMNTML